LALLSKSAIAARQDDAAERDDALGLDDANATESSDTLSDIGHLGSLAAWAPTYSGFLEQVEVNRNLAAAGYAEESQKPSDWPKEWGKKLKKAKMVGQGAFGKVYVAPIACLPSQSVAVKEQTFKSIGTKSSIRKEIKLMKAFSGPEFVSFFDSSEVGGSTRGSINIMMEAASSDLSGVLKKNKARSAVKSQLFVEMLRGIAVMHEEGFIHRDLKPANILISGKCGTEPCHAKVADLGLSCSHSGKISKCDGIGGTPLYMAPETYRHAADPRTVSYKAGVQSKNDVWALGLIFFEMLFGHLPKNIRNSASMNALERNIKRFTLNGDPDYESLKTKGHDELVELFDNMLASQPGARWSAAEALPKAEVVARAFGAHFPEMTVEGTQLPECWNGIKQLPEFVMPAVRPGQHAPSRPIEGVSGEDGNGEDDEDDSDGELIFLTFINPSHNIKVNMLRKMWLPDGTIKIPDTVRPEYRHSQLRDGDVIEEVAGVPFADITDSTWNLIKEGAFGAVRNAPIVVKLRRKHVAKQAAKAAKKVKRHS